MSRLNGGKPRFEGAQAQGAAVITLDSQCGLGRALQTSGECEADGGVGSVDLRFCNNHPAPDHGRGGLIEQRNEQRQELYGAMGEVD